MALKVLINRHRGGFAMLDSLSKWWLVGNAICEDCFQYFLYEDCYRCSACDRALCLACVDATGGLRNIVCLRCINEEQAKSYAKG
jgi:hypothetical protein